MVESYSRDHVRRLLKVSKRQLDSWERQTFVRGGEVFSFRDIIAMRALLKLREKRVPPVKIGTGAAGAAAEAVGD